MGVSRNISIKFHSKHEKSYLLVRDFLVGLWFENEDFKVRTFYKDESDNDDISNEISFKEVEDVFNIRDSLKKRNTISFGVEELNEGLIISIQILDNQFSNDQKFELDVSPGGAHKLNKFDRYTDFSFYLNILLPRIRELEGQVVEITCEDLG